MENKVYIFGHQNPDTDSICSSIAYADFKQQLNIDAIPVRIGRINRETEFVLNYFGVEEPEYFPTAKTQVSNLQLDTSEAVSAETSLNDAWQIVKATNLKVLPVEDKEHKFCGLISVSDIANAYMDMPENNVLSLSHTPIENVVHTLKANVHSGTGKSFYGSGKTIVAAVTPDIMGTYMGKGDIVFVGNRKDNQIKAIELGAFCVVVTCGSEVDDEVIKAAQNNDCILLTTVYDTFTAARLLYQSIPVGFIMTSENINAFHVDDYVDTVKEKMLETRYRYYPVIDNAGMFQGFITRYQLINKKRKKLILVDHNERSQSISGIEQAEILEIIDHHRIGDVQTGNPIYYRNEPVGSTATIIANLFFENFIKPSDKIAGILCAAILSDTVAFKSPTSTRRDYDTASRLAQICDINMNSFAVEMFKNGFSLKNMTSKEIIHNDFKEYTIGTSKIGVGQVNTADLESVSTFRTPLIHHMNEMIENSGFSAVLLLITDIINEETEVLFTEAQKGVIAKGFNPLIDENSFTMKGVVSRKKQIVPVLTDLFSGL